MSPAVEHIILLAISTLGVILSAYFSSRAKKHANTALRGAEYVEKSLRPPPSPWDHS